MNKVFFSTLAVVLSLHFSTAAVGDDELSESKSGVEQKKIAPIGLTGYDLAEEESGVKPKVTGRFILPPYVSVRKENSSFKSVFPFYFYSERFGEGARRDLGILPFYWSHQSNQFNTKVYFPFFWKIDGRQLKTRIVLQTYWSHDALSYKFGSAPLFYISKNKKNGESYQIVIPPLFWNFKHPSGGFTFSLLYFNKRDKDNFRRGVIPIYFSTKKNDRTITTIAPPLFWHISDPVNYKTTTVLPPVFFKTRENGWSAGLLPVLYFARDRNWSRNMVLPFYYGSKVNDLKSHYLPLLLSYWKHSDTLRQGGIAFLYHWYDFDGDFFRMYSPMVWKWGNARRLSQNFLLPPLFYKGKSPVEDNTMVGLIYWNFHDFHISRTLSIAPIFATRKNLQAKGFRTWVFPSFDFGNSEVGFHFRIHPLLYMGREKEKRHLVLAPLFWNLENSKSNSTVVFPVWWNLNKHQQKRLARVAFPVWWQIDDYKYKEYNRVIFPLFWDFQKKEPGTRTTLIIPPVFWRVSDKESARTGVLNVSIHKGANKGNEFWTFNIFPLFLVGKPPAPTGARWELLHGLAGWRRQGHTKEMKIFWIPISIGD